MRAARATDPEAGVIRFQPHQRIEHLVLIVTFIALAVTGLVQRYYSVGLSQWLISVMGGIETTRLIHRGFALVLTLGIAYHLAWLDYRLFTRHARPSMLPTFQDFRDIVNELKRGLGLKAAPTHFGRYDYRQKFEYVGLICGSLILIVTGFILAYPVAVTRLFDGQVVAAALEFHGYEATLAVLVILIWHLWDVVFKPGIFPGDTSIFTGRISPERLREEHYLEYAELTRKAPAGE
ncbi:MAG: cytochrome C [Chloroflexi bacterium]|nr:cytochrome C [Chloroflexota bacterium]